MIFGPGDISAAATPLDVAHAFLGVQETSRNRGPMIDKWVLFVGLDPEGEHPWCAAAVSWWCWRGGRPIAKGASVYKLLMRNTGLLVDTPQPGDVCLHLGTGGKGHCGLVIRVLPNGAIESIEGNTNEEGSREGNSVAIHNNRPLDYWDRFLRPVGQSEHR